MTEGPSLTGYLASDIAAAFGFVIAAGTAILGTIVALIGGVVASGFLFGSLAGTLFGPGAFEVGLLFGFLVGFVVAVKIGWKIIGVAEDI